MMSLTKKIAWNTLVQVVGKVIYTLLSLVIIIYLTRYLGVAGYGEYNIVIVFLGFFAVVADFGLNTIMMREISIKPRDRDRVIANAMSLRIITAIALMLLTILISRFFPYSREVKLGIAVFSIGIFFALINQIFLGIFQVDLRMDKAAITEVLGRVLTLIITLWFIKIHLGLVMIIMSAVIGNFLNVFINFLLIRSYVRLNLKFDPKLMKKLFYEALPIAVVIFLAVVFFKMDSIFLSVLSLKNVVFGPAQGLTNIQAVGIYGAPYRILEVLLTIPGIFVGLVYPIISAHFCKSSKQGQVSFQKAFDFLAIGALLITYLLFSISPQIISLIGGKDFAKSVIVLEILAFGLGISFFISIINYTLIATGRQKKLIIPYIGYLIFNIIAYLILIPRYSYIGTAAVTVATQFLMFIVGLVLINKYLRFLPRFLVVLKSATAALISGYILWFLSHANWIFNMARFENIRIIEKALLILGVGITSSSIYLLILYLLKAISKDSLKAIFGREKINVSETTFDTTQGV